ncbi:MAG: hypothetical protein PHH85_02005 [Candidatus Methanoperedens sp.]|nr:hypothetical protein [Candidatus Methanoperedens sp.]
MSDVACVLRLAKYISKHENDLDEADINTVAQAKRDLSRVAERVMERRGDTVD